MVQDKNLYLVGFMGVGKSVVARSLAASLNKCFVDLDSAIEAKESHSIQDIFNKQGEAYFRSIERHLIQDLIKERGYIVACGGGLIVQPGLLELLENNGVVIALRATEETIWNRLKNDRSRPLLNVNNPRKAIQELLKARRPFYESVQKIVDVDEKPLEEVVMDVQRLYLSILGKI